MAWCASSCLRLACLDDRERRVILLLYGLDGEACTMAGERMGLKRERVRPSATRHSANSPPHQAIGGYWGYVLWGCFVGMEKSILPK